MCVVHSKEIFSSPVFKDYSGHSFSECIFKGKAFKCSFYLAVFYNCVFDNDFIFSDCNLYGVDGINPVMVDGGVYLSRLEYENKRKR